MAKRSGGKQQQPNEAVLYGVLGVVLLGCAVYIYTQFAAPSTPAPAAAPTVTSAPAQTRTTAAAAGGTAQKTTSAKLDPALHMEAMLVTESLEYAGSGRNIFSPNSAPPPPRVIPQAIAPVRQQAMAPPVQSGPLQPPPPPPIDLKFFGTSTTRDGKRSVFLLHGDDVYHAAEGDIVGRRYKVISIATSAVVMEDMTNNNRQTLPLEAQ